jgi:hypothetical protein
LAFWFFVKSLLLEMANHNLPFGRPMCSFSILPLSSFSSFFNWFSISYNYKCCIVTQVGIAYSKCKAFYICCLAYPCIFCPSKTITQGMHYLNQLPVSHIEVNLWMVDYMPSGKHMQEMQYGIVNHHISYLETTPFLVLPPRCLTIVPAGIYVVPITKAYRYDIHCCTRPGYNIDPFYGV